MIKNKALLFISISLATAPFQVEAGEVTQTDPMFNPVAFISSQISEKSDTILTGIASLKKTIASNGISTQHSVIRLGASLGTAGGGYMCIKGLHHLSDYYATPQFFSNTNLKTTKDADLRARLDTAAWWKGVINILIGSGFITASILVYKGWGPLNLYMPTSHT